MILRDYQVEAVDAGLKYFIHGRSYHGALMVLPTGSGKSLVIAGIASELREPTLVFQPTKEILEQNIGKMQNYGIPVSVYSASKGRREIGKLTFATIGSVRRHPEQFDHFKNIIIDECHLVNAKGGMYSDFLKDTDISKVIGLTATPYRLTTDGYGGSILKFLTRTRPRIFTDLIHVTQNKTLFDDGYLAPLEYTHESGFDRSRLRLNSTGADFTDKSIKAYYRQINFHDSLSNIVKQCLDAGRENVLVFTRFIEESQYLVDSMNGDAEIVTSKTKKREREQIIGRFRSGRTKVVTNVGVLTVGFDYPELETIVLARPTMSLALYYQMIGRGIRIHPEKDHTLVVDLCDNFDNFGKVEDLNLTCSKPGLWFIESNGRQLTNVYYDDRGN